VTAAAGETSTVKLKLQNYNTPPERLALKVEGVPKDWRVAVLGGGNPVAAAMPAPNESVALQLRIDVPREATPGTRRLLLSARGRNVNAELPIDVMIGEGVQAKLAVKAKLPSLRGSAKSSFEYQFTVENESGKDELVKLDAQAPQGFQTSFTEAFGSQEISSLPIEAGQSKDLKVKVQPPENAAASDYPVMVGVSAEGAQASTALTVQVTGEPRLRLTGEEGRLSGEAQAGKATPLALVLSNDGSASASNIELSGSPPADWTIDINPASIPSLGPREKRTVQAVVTPSSKAVAGDYMTTMRATSHGESSSADFRITVTTSTLWGIVGVIIIAIALLVGVGAVSRFGRR
jgi:uncharacterized membrane protein